MWIAGSALAVLAFFGMRTAQQGPAGEAAAFFALSKAAYFAGIGVLFLAIGLDFKQEESTLYFASCAVAAGGLFANALLIVAVLAVPLDPGFLAAANGAVTVVGASPMLIVAYGLLILEERRRFRFVAYALLIAVLGLALLAATLLGAETAAGRIAVVAGYVAMVAFPIASFLFALGKN